MEHYDGPAFYRKFPVKPTPVEHEKPLTQRAASQVKHRQERNARTQREAAAAHDAVKNLKLSPKTAPRHPVNTPTNGNYRPFQVTEVPRQLHWSTRELTPRRQRYQRLIERLHKPLTSFLTLARPQAQTANPTPTQSLVAATGATPSLASTLTAAPAQTMNSAQSVQSVARLTMSATASLTSLSLSAAEDSRSAVSMTATPVDNGSSLTATTASTASTVTSTATAEKRAEPAPTEIIYPQASAETSLSLATASFEDASTSRPVVASRRPVDYLPVGTPVAPLRSDTSSESTQGSGEDAAVQRLLQRTSTTATSAEASASVSASAATTEARSVVRSDASMAAARQSTAGEGTSSASDTAKSKPSRGLGMALGDIMQEEGNDQRHLALFADAPQAAAPTSHQETGRGYHFPGLDLLPKPVVPDEAALDEWIEHQAEVLDATLSAFHVDAHVTDWTIGPTVTQFQISLALGVKVNKITNLNDDLKLALAAKDIRIEAPIPGKTTVGIEIPNLKSRPVMLSEILNSSAFKQSESPLTVALGVDLFGKPQVTDLRKMPHGLIAGATGSGKSVFINSLLLSILYKANPQQVKLLLIDPKAVEMAPYDGLPHLLSPVISDPKAAAAALKWVVTEMDQRYEKLAAAGVRNIEQFNDRADANDEPGLKMPYIVIVIDELADLMMMAASEVQDYIVRITQKARAAGIHLLVATQRPSVDIVTGTIKNNIPTRIAFMVSSQVDSRTILDTTGAESLLGRGDMLYLGNGASQPMRLQGAYVEAEVDQVTDFVRTQGKPHYAFEPKGLLQKETNEENQDELLPEVLTYISQEKTVSTSKLQRVFSIGYNRAANLIDDLERHHYVSPQHGSKPREVYLTPDDLGKDLPEPHDQDAPYSS